MRVLVIGRNGQLARSLAEGPAPPGVEVLPAGRPGIDLLTPETLEPVMDRIEPRLVVNAAAYTAVDEAESEPDLAHALNAEAPAHLAALCERAGVPFIHLSTDYVFDGTKDAPYREDDAPSPAGVYGASKLAGERRVAEACARHVILRTAWVHSPFGGNFVRTMLRLAEERDTVNVVDDQAGSPTYAPHLAEAILALARRLASEADAEPAWGVYHAAGAGETTWCGLAREVFRHSAGLGGPAATVEPIATADFPTAASRPANSRLDCARLKTRFGLALPDWRTGVAANVARLAADFPGYARDRRGSAA